jgi:hypothetical protein
MGAAPLAAGVGVYRIADLPDGRKEEVRSQPSAVSRQPCAIGTSYPNRFPFSPEKLISDVYFRTSTFERLSYNFFSA